ncbi:unnamed protein product [Vicia faba]|uniref:Uncharacterized protein n=1 Tax=Vicia faba TaxID=3906 RepID=A0AAV0ZBV8_VICFA|nr:unnamed protein product [Vicia faba]
MLPCVNFNIYVSMLRYRVCKIKPIQFKFLHSLKKREFRQSIGRLVRDAVNTECDVAIDKDESNIISNILSIDFDPGDDSLTSPHNIAKLLTDNTDSQPDP